MSILECCRRTGKDAFEFIRDLLVEERNRVGMIIFMMKEENLKKILAHPLVGVGCDGGAISPEGVLGKGKPHPRHYGTFPRVLGKYIREEKITRLMLWFSIRKQSLIGRLGPILINFPKESSMYLSMV